MAIVYQYDADGIYIGEADDYGGPMPHNCAALAPPAAAPVLRPRWTGQGWGLAEDHRGEIGYDTETGAEVEIKSIGPWPAELAREPRPGPTYEWDGQAWTESPAKKRAARIAEVKARLAALDDKYLPSRILAGLAVGDAYAKAQWDAHEVEAQPLRAELVELEVANG